MRHQTLGFGAAVAKEGAAASLGLRPKAPLLPYIKAAPSSLFLIHPIPPPPLLSSPPPFLLCLRPPHACHGSWNYLRTGRSSRRSKRHQLEGTWRGWRYGGKGGGGEGRGTREGEKKKGGEGGDVWHTPHQCGILLYL